MDDGPRTRFNRELLDQVLNRSEIFRRDPLEIFPWLLRPCRVRVLLVTDGGLDFSQGDFGLSTFVSILQNDGLPYVRFDLTLAHLSESVTDAQVMMNAPGIPRSIKGFRFDNPDHFAPDMYDEVWLFGIETSFHRGFYPHRNNNRNTYPADRLSDQELATLSEFMNQGGGLFATGDHGLLGRCLGGSVTRARSMRLWSSTAAQQDLDEVSMGGARRNDTNQVGHDPGTQFDDQSDDVPQRIQPRLYRSRVSPFLEARYPHPLLCGPDGIITVMPDHPHEGECVEPTDLSATYPYDGTEEYPMATAGGGRIAPEVIAHSNVPAGNNAQGTKTATLAHRFGSICAYDGHRAGVGRVVTDATWHHFVNVNLIGVVGVSDALVKGRGFLASATGEAHLENIKAYYRNIAVWISPPPMFGCFRRRLLWALLTQHRIMEAVLATPQIALREVDVSVLFELGVYARDVLGRIAGRCQSLRFIIDLVWPEIPELIPEIDPWEPFLTEPERPPLPWVDPTPVLSIALGGALVALREAFPYPDTEIVEQVDERADEVIQAGISFAVREGLSSWQETLERYGGLARGQSSS